MLFKLRRMLEKASWSPPSSPSTGPSHVDVVKNEWLAGYQVVVARVTATDTGVDVDAHDPWVDMVKSYRQDDLDNTAFVASLHERIRGDYVFATSPHQAGECPYHEMVVPMQVIETDSALEAERGVRSRRHSH